MGADPRTPLASASYSSGVRFQCEFRENSPGFSIPLVVGFVDHHDRVAAFVAPVAGIEFFAICNDKRPVETHFASDGFQAIKYYK